MSELPVALLEWQSAPKNSLCGFAKVRFGRFLCIARIVVHCSHGKSWIQLPSEPWTDPSGNTRFTPFLSFDSGDQAADRRFADEFRDAVLAAIEAAHPGATTNDWAGRPR